MGKYTCTRLPRLSSHRVLPWTHVALSPSFGCVTAGLLKVTRLQVLSLQRGKCKVSETCFFKFSYWWPLGVNAIAGLVEARSPFASFSTIYPSSSACIRIICIFQFGSCWFARALGAGDGAGSEAWVRRGPRRWRSVAPAMHTEQCSAFLLTEGARVRVRAWHWLGAGSALRTGVLQSEKEGGFSLLFPLKQALRHFILLEFAYL